MKQKALKKKLYKAKEIFKVRQHLFKVIPPSSELKVKYNKNEFGEYESHIQMKVPNVPKIVAKKTNASLQKSMHSASRAALKQIEKFKRKSKIKQRFTRHLKEAF